MGLTPREPGSAPLRGLLVSVLFSPKKELTPIIRLPTASSRRKRPTDSAQSSSSGPTKLCMVSPELTIFLSETRYIPAPLERTYLQAWAVFPALLKELIDPTAG